MLEESPEGDRVRAEFDEVANGSYKRLCAEDGRMDKNQLKAYIDYVNEQMIKKGLKAREHTDEYHDMIWECCKGYNPDNERRT